MVFFKRWICGTRYLFTPGSLVPGTTDIFSMPVSVPGYWYSTLDLYLYRVQYLYLLKGILGSGVAK